MVMGQMNGDFRVKEDHLLKYFHLASALFKEFEKIRILHIPREKNARADMLSKLSTGKDKGQLTTIIRQVLLQPTIECHAVTTGESTDWRTNMRGLMKKQDDGETLRQSERRKIARFVLIGNDLYRRGFSSPLLKCLAEEEAYYVMDELHNGICGFHTGGRTLKDIIGRLWRTMR